MERTVQPEILDHLPADDPEAIRSRKDLRRVNWFMGNARTLRREIERLPIRPSHIVEIGAGEGTLLLSAIGPAPTGAIEPRVTLLDLRDLLSEEVSDRYRSRGWYPEVRTGDVFDTLEEADLVVANLFLHHFEDPRIGELLSRIHSRARAFIAIEPRRSRFGAIGASLLGCIGCNRVTRHDAVVSVAAGFQDKELSSLWPQGGNWQIEERLAPPFSHLFSAHLAS